MAPSQQKKKTEAEVLGRFLPDLLSRNKNTPFIVFIIAEQRAFFWSFIVFYLCFIQKLNKKKVRICPKGQWQWLVAAGVSQCHWRVVCGVAVVAARAAHAHRRKWEYLI